MTVSVLGHMPQSDMSEATAWFGAADTETRPPSGSNAISTAAKIAMIEALRRDRNKLMSGLSRGGQALASARYVWGPCLRATHQCLRQAPVMDTA